jgi:Flp pilus assembly protein TadD
VHPSSSTVPPRRALIRAAIVLFLWVLVLYGRALGYGFVYDDVVLIAQNPALGDLATLPEALTHELFHHAEGRRATPYWRPTVTLSYYVDHLLGGGAPWVFHLTNLLSFTALGLGLWRLVASCVGEALAWGVTFLFLAHPLQVEGAVNIAGRTDLICGAALIWTVQARSKAGVVLGTLVACGAKELGALAPALVAILGAPGAWRASAVTVALWLAARGLVLSGEELEAAGPTARSIQEAGARAIWLFTRAVAPTALAPGLTLPSMNVVQTLLGWIAIVALTAGALWRGAVLVRAGTLLVALPLLAVGGLATSKLRYGETLLVLPLLGLALIVAEALTPLGRRGIVALMGLAAVCGAVSARRAPEWADERTLWAASHARLPNDPLIRLNLARSLLPESAAEAEALLQGVTHDDPRTQRELHAARAKALLSLNREAEALPLLLAASAPEEEAAWATSAACVRIPPGSVAGRRHGETLCGWALGLDPNDPALHNALGMHRVAAGDHSGAKDAFAHAVSLAPTHPAYAKNLEIASADTAD